MKAVALIALTCLALTACGGDDSSPAASGGSGTSNNGGTGGTGGTGSGGTGSGGGGGSGGSGGSGGGTLTWRYEAQPVAADKASFLTLVNNEGAKGYRYLGDYYYSASNGGTQSIFVNDGTAQTYTYQLQNAPADMTSFVNTANAQGSSGYRYEGPLTYGDLYRDAKPHARPKRSAAAVSTAWEMPPGKETLPGVPVDLMRCNGAIRASRDEGRMLAKRCGRLDRVNFREAGA